MNITPHIEIWNKGVYLTKHDTLIFGDLHIGVEGSKQHIHAPLFHFEDLLYELSRTIAHHVKRIVINGDLKEEFGKINEKNKILALLALCQAHCDELIIISGNHDPLLAKIAPVQEYLLLDDTLITHGDKIIDNLSKEKKSEKKEDEKNMRENTISKKKTNKNELKKVARKEKPLSAIKIIIISHEHPAITLESGPRTEKYPCLISGIVKKQRIIVLPALNPLSSGTDIRLSKQMSPYLPAKLNDFDCWIVDDKPRYFGKIKDLVPVR